MTSDQNDSASKDNRIKELEAKIEQLEEKIERSEDAGARGEDEEAEESGGAAGILGSIANIVPGLGGVIRSLSKSPAFRERLEEIDEEIDRRMRETPLKEVGPEVTGGVSKRPLGVPPGVRDRRSPTAAGRPTKRKHPQEEVAAGPPEEFEVDVHDEGDHVLAIADLPGVDEKDVRVAVHGQTLSITVEAPGRRRSRQVALPCAVEGKPESSLSKGILKIRLTKATGG